MLFVSFLCGWCVQDCSKALLLDPAYTKAHHRRGTARHKLGRVLEAAEDFECALRLDPTNASARAERDACIKEVVVAEALKEPSQRSKLKVEVVSAQGGNTTKAAPAASAATPEMASVSTKETTTLHSSEGNSPSSSSRQVPPPAGKAAAAPSAVSAATIATAAAAVASAQLRTILQAPKTSTEFESAWRGMCGVQAQEASYLKLLEPDQLPAIFKSSLTPQVLSALLRTILAEAASGASSSGVEAPAAVSHWAQLLLNLSKVPRFDMTVMCLPSRDKAVLRPLWDEAAGGLALALGGDGAEDRLKKAYRL